MGSDPSAWVPSRAALKRRIERALDISTKDAGSHGAVAPQTLPNTGLAKPSQGAVRTLSTRIDRLAVEQFRGLSRIETELRELRLELDELRLVPLLRSDAVEVCQIQDMLVGIPSEEWRLLAYCRHRGAPEPGTLRRFRELAKPGMCVADVGANLGIFTIAAAIEVGAEGTVFAFEPTPRTYSVLQQNVQLNGFLGGGRVLVQQLALCDRTGTSQFGLHYSDCGHNSLYTLMGVDRVIEVKTLSLDDAIPERRLDLVKIDAEGAEPAVLRGMKGHITRNPEIQVIAEFAPALLHNANADPISFLREIEDLGLEYRLIAEPGGEIVEFGAAKLLELESANLLLRRGDAA